MSLSHAVPLNQCTHSSGGKASPEKETEAQRQTLANGRADTQTHDDEAKVKAEFNPISTIHSLRTSVIQLELRKVAAIRRKP